jgi:hypothetical protein
MFNVMIVKRNIRWSLRRMFGVTAVSLVRGFALIVVRVTRLKIWVTWLTSLTMTLERGSNYVAKY